MTLGWVLVVAGVYAYGDHVYAYGGCVYAYEAWVVCMHMEVVYMYMEVVCMHMRRGLSVCIWTVYACVCYGIMSSVSLCACDSVNW